MPDAVISSEMLAYRSASAWLSGRVRQRRATASPEAASDAADAAGEPASLGAALSDALSVVVLAQALRRSTAPTPTAMEPRLRMNCSFPCCFGWVLRSTRDTCARVDIMWVIHSAPSFRPARGR